MTGLLSDLGIALPILAAPMAGGPSTPALVTAAARAGGLGFLAGGYKSPQALAEQIDAVRAEGVLFGVNLFAPNPVPIRAEEYRSYARLMQAEADAYELELPGAEPVEDDDRWREKIDLLLGAGLPWVSFTFGLPGRAVIGALRRAGTAVLQTVTSTDEARQAAEAGVDALIVQGADAGGHSATLTPERPAEPVPLPELVGRVRDAAPLPVLAAGGIATGAAVAEALRAGAQAAMVGTVLLRTEESGASAAHQAALADPAFETTAVTRAFTGRPARGLRNYFIERYEPIAPAGYPALHHLTAPLRRAATAAGDTRLIHLWAGTGYRHAETGPLSGVFERLAADL